MNNEEAIIKLNGQIKGLLEIIKLLGERIERLERNE
jgi:hypothetical protein